MHKYFDTPSPCMLMLGFEDAVWGHFREGGHLHGATACLRCGATIGAGGSFVPRLHFRAHLRPGACVPCCILELTEPYEDQELRGDLVRLLQLTKTLGGVVREKPKVFPCLRGRCTSAYSSQMLKFFTESLPRHLPHMLAADPMLLASSACSGPSLGFILAVAISNTVLPSETTTVLLDTVYCNCNVPSRVLDLFHPDHPAYADLHTRVWERSLRCTWVTACVLQLEREATV